MSEKQNGDSVVNTIILKDRELRADERLRRMLPAVNSLHVVTGPEFRETESAKQTLESHYYWESGNERWLKDSRGIAIGVDTRGDSQLGSAEELSTINRIASPHRPVHWRSTIMFGRGIATYISTPELAPLFDQIVDSACIDRRASR